MKIPILRIGSNMVCAFLGAALMLGSLRAQINEVKLSEIAPPSPEVAGLGLYGEIPISHHSGHPNISIPLLTVKEGDIELPIAMSYHTGSNKVLSESGWLGLGWSLTGCVGSISRVIRDKDDLAPGGFYQSGYNYAPDKITQLEVESGITFKRHNVMFYPGAAIMLPKDGVSTNYASYFSAGTIDFSTDEYTFNLPGFAGKFYVRVLDDGQGGKVPVFQCQAHQDIRIEYLDLGATDINGYKSWRITLPNGMQYLFKSIQHVGTGGSPTLTLPLPDVSAWHLTDIISPRGNHVTFTYNVSPNGPFEMPIPGYSRNLFEAAQSQNYPNENMAEQPRLNYTALEPHHLQRIDYSTGKVEFVTDTREDLNNGKRLKLIKKFVYNKSGQPLLHKELEFDNAHYFMALPEVTGQNYSHLLQFNSTFPYANLNNVLSKRLKLNHVKLKGSDLSLIEKHEFEYYETGNDRLPIKTSYSIDHWGYYNGRPNTDLVPGATWVNNFLNTYPISLLPGADREGDSSYYRGFLLKKINYPTGGSTTMGFEAKAYQNPIIEFEKETITGTVGFRQGVYDNTNPGEFTYQANDNRFYFTLGRDNGPAPFNMPLKLDIGCVVADCNIFNCNPSPLPKVYLRDANAPYNVAHTFELTYDGLSNTFNHLDETILVPPGDYMIEFDFAFSGLFSSDLIFVAQVSWDNLLHDLVAEKYSSSARVKWLKRTTNDGAPEIKTDYVYELGKLHEPPVYNHYSYELLATGVQGGIPNFFPFFTRSATPVYSFSGFAGGNPIGYSKVTEFNSNGNDESGKVEYEFTNEVNYSFYEIYSPDYLDVPPGIPTFSHYPKGDLKRKSTYKSENGSYSLIHKTENIYAFPTFSSNNTYFHDIGGLLHRPISFNLNQASETRYIAYQYLHRTYFNPLLETKETIYDDGGTSTTTTTTFEYNSDNHFQMTASETAESDGRMLKYVYKYPSDYRPSLPMPSGSSFQDLIDDFFIANPIEVQQWKFYPGETPRLFKGLINSFRVTQDNQGQLGFIAPHRTYLLDVENPILQGVVSNAEQLNTNTHQFDALIPYFSNTADQYESKISYNYDSKGRLVQNQLADGTPVNYTWIGDKQLPSAQIRNAFVNQAAFTSFEFIGKNSPLESTTEDGGWKIQRSIFGGWTNSTGNVQTGDYGFLLLPNNQRYVYKDNLPEGRYHIAFWYKGDPIEITISNGGGTYYSHTGTGNNPTEMAYKELLVDIPANATISIKAHAGASTCIIDELRLFPEGAQMSTFSYDQYLRLQSQSDPNGKSIYYLYDGAGRLAFILDQDGNYISGNQYKLKN